MFGKDAIWAGAAVEAHPNIVEKDFEIKILPENSGFGERICRKWPGELAFLREVWYYRTVNIEERSKIGGKWESPFKDIP